MKRFVTALLALAVSFSVFAQKGPEKDRERIQAEKIAYITQELDLSPSEAEKFWPLYNEVQKEQAGQLKAVREKQDALRAAVREGKSDAEIKPLLDAWVAARKAQSYSLVEHNADFVKVLGEAKTAKLYLSEEGFRNRQIRRIAGQNPEFDELFKAQGENNRNAFQRMRGGREEK